MRRLNKILICMTIVCSFSDTLEKVHGLIGRGFPSDFWQEMAIFQPLRFFQVRIDWIFPGSNLELVIIGNNWPKVFFLTPKTLCHKLELHQDWYLSIHKLLNLLFFSKSFPLCLIFFPFKIWKVTQLWLLSHVNFVLMLYKAIYNDLRVFILKQWLFLLYLLRNDSASNVVR